LRDATVVELGCGSVNPLGALLVHLLAGAREVHGFDLDPPQDLAAATRALARLATYMLANPAWLAPDLGLTHDDVARQLAGFDLVRLWHGDPGGIDARRLQLHRAPAEHTGLASGSVDLVYSVSFLEHVADPDLVVAELARITAASGCGVHGIDVADHAAYGTPRLHPLDFLRRPLGPALVNGSNRLRLQQFVPVFERHGFTVTACEVHQRIEVDDALRASFAPPFRELDRDVLAALGGMLFVRRR
jgi:SAM-dependent methyltransferase